jgi:NAD(P)-dependent dehydrogenase (short-subunit alcohol dehydrogenase family)
MTTLPPNSVALVTGSGRGLGRAIAERLAALGAHVAIHDQFFESPAVFGEAPNIDVVAAAIGTNHDVSTTAVVADIAKLDQVQAAVAKIEATLGPISILVNAAGGDIGASGKGKPSPNDALNISLEDLHAIFDRNLIGTMLVCKSVIPGMIERQRGSVVSIASVAAHIAVEQEVAYSVAKAGIVQYTRCLAVTLRKHGVRANVVSPGPTKTARFMATRTTDADMMNDEKASLVRYGNPSEIADAVAFLSSLESKFISGQVLPVDGGWVAHAL